MPRSRALRTAAATLTVLVATAAPALAHTSVSPGTMSSGDQDVELTFQAPGERVDGEGDVVFNESLRVLVPSPFAVDSCTGPQAGLTGWTCEIDTAMHAPHTLVTYTVGELATAGDVQFRMVVDAPADGPGTYLFRSMQTYADGFTAPWNYEAEPYPAPRIVVDGDETVVNGDGAEGNACFGPPQPASSAEHDGSDGGVAPCPTTADADPTGSDQPTDGTAVDDERDTAAPTTEPDAEVTAAAATGGAAGDGRELANTGGGAALLALGLAGIASTLRRRGEL